jgi:hypothetical protein
MTNRSRTALTALVAVCMWMPLGAHAQSGDCERSVVVDSADPELRADLSGRLAAHGLDVVSSTSGSACGFFSVAITLDETSQYQVTLQDADGHSSSRSLRDIDTVITLVESWARPNAADSLGLLFPEPAAPEALPGEGSAVAAVTPPVPESVEESAVAEAPAVVVPEVAEAPPETVEGVASPEPEVAVLLLLPPRHVSPVPSFSAVFAQSGAELSQAGARIAACMGAGRVCGGYDATFAAGPAASPASSSALAAWLHADVALVSSFRHTLIFTGVGLGARWMSGSAVFSRLPDDQQRTIVDSTGGASDDGAGAGTDPVDPVDPGDEGTGDGTDPVIPDDNGEEEEAEEETEFEQEAEQKAVGDDPANGRVADSFSLSTQLFIHFDIPLNDRIALTPGAAFLIAPLSNSIEAYRPPGLDWSVLVWVGLRPGRHR